jgi:hypothetical protein
MYALFGGIAGSVFIFSAFVALTKEPAFWLATGMAGMVLAAFLSWMATTKLTLGIDSIHYRSLFVTKDISLVDVVEAKIGLGFRSSQPFQRLVLKVRGQRGKREITINLGLFDLAEAKKWVDALNARLP